MWTALFLTLPSQPQAVRLRVWRALKGLGSGLLRDGVYVLPTDRSQAFSELADEVRAHAGVAQVFALASDNAAQQAELRALFDRGEAYQAWRADLQTLQSAMGAMAEADARRRLRAQADALQAITRIDFYPGAAAEQAAAELDALRRALDTQFSKGEPTAGSPHPIERLDARQFQGKHWVTRERPWVDRLACAWLIARFIDRSPTFVWLSDPAGATPPPRAALGYDFDGARFSHVGTRVSFEVMATSFCLDADPRLQRLSRLVHHLDAGGIPVPEAAGLEAVLLGLREMHPSDEALMHAAHGVFDALYAAPLTRGATP